MLRCLTKSKVDCSFQNNEFRFKNRGFTQFFFGFLFFLSFLRSTLDEINTKRYVKNYGFFFGNKREKKKKKHSSYGRKKIWKKKRPGRDSNPRSSVAMATITLPYETDALPLGHRAAHSYWGKN